MTSSKPSPAKETTKLLAEIVAGRYDGQLVAITEAIVARLQAGETSMLWRITLPDGDTWDAETATVGELRYAEGVTGLSYLDLNPGKSHTQFAALVAGHYKAQGMDLKDALAKADAITQTDAVAAVELYEGTLGKGSGATSS